MGRSSPGRCAWRDDLAAYTPMAYSQVCGSWKRRSSHERFWNFSAMRKKDFDNLVESIRQAGSIRRGAAQPSRLTACSAVDVKAIRQGLDKSQSEFARMIGVSVATLQNWEQGRRQPVGPARALLRVAAANPAVVSEALSQL